MPDGQRYRCGYFTIKFRCNSKQQKIKKKVATRFGTIEVPNNHILNKSGGSFQMSSYLQELVCYIGQSNVFEEGSKILLKTNGIEVNAKQIERVCHYYGEELELSKREAKEPVIAVFNESLRYVLMDGCMLLTKHDKWKELKLGRIFEAKELVDLSDKRSEIRKSVYVAHLGDSTTFLQKLEKEIQSYNQFVFINDGALWIWDWVQSNYPNAIQILDYYHAIEHLCDFANSYFKDEHEKKKWIEIQQTLLLSDKVDAVIETITAMQTKDSVLEIKKNGLLNYYTKNKKRMMYLTFKQKNLVIGSGAIEAAHRNVIQKRCKLSGQRWTPKGLQQIVNLRVECQSNRWENIIKLTNKMAA